MRHTLQFEVRGDTAEVIQSAAEEITLQFFGPDADIRSGNIYINTAADYEAATWVGRVSVDVRDRPAKPEKKAMSANTRFEVLGYTLAEIVALIDERLSSLYDTEEFSYSIEIEPFEDRWLAKVVSWLGSNDMGDF